MAKDDLTGNMPTENLIFYFDEEGIDPELMNLLLSKPYRLPTKFSQSNFRLKADQCF